MHVTLQNPIVRATSSLEGVNVEWKRAVTGMRLAAGQRHGCESAPIRYLKSHEPASMNEGVQKWKAENLGALV